MFNKFVADCIGHLSEDDFKSIFFDLPRHLRSVAFQLPPGVTADVKDLPERQRPAMYARLADLRRERCLNISDSSQQHNWANQSWDLVPMSRTCKSHFFEIMRLIPVQSSDPTVWGQVLTRLKQSPAKNDRKTDLAPHLDANAIGVHGGALRGVERVCSGFTAGDQDCSADGPPGRRRRSRSRRRRERRSPASETHLPTARPVGRSRGDSCDSEPQEPPPCPPGTWEGGSRSDVRASHAQRHSSPRPGRSRQF